MIDTLKPYTEYKKSGLPWLDAVPEHWDMVPNRALMQDQRQVVGENATDYTLLSLTLGGIIPRNMDNPKGKFPAQFNTYKVVKPEDIVFCLFDIDETPRGVGHSKLKGMITGAYDVFSPRRSINPRFLYLYYLFVDEGKLLKPLYTGLRKTIQRGVFASLKAPLPPLDEQAAIVRFLDHANLRIDRFIKAKKKVIALLNEQKQAIIHHAVTRGLDPNVPLKPSGIPWLGDILAHWEIRPLKHWAKLNSRSLSEKTSPKYEFNYIDIGSVGTGRLTRQPERFRFKQAPSRARRIVSFGDTIISTVRTYLKAVYFINEHRDNLIASTGFAVLSPGPHVVPEFLSFLIQSSVFIDQVTANSIGIAYPAIAESRIGTFHLAIPPDKTEQKEILEHIQREMNPFDSALAQAQREIDLVREYRTRLIADVVTGKLDVREAAKNLLVEATESNIIDEDEEMTNSMNGEEGE